MCDGMNSRVGTAYDHVRIHGHVVACTSLHVISLRYTRSVYDHDMTCFTAATGCLAGRRYAMCIESDETGHCSHSLRTYARSAIRMQSHVGTACDHVMHSITSWFALDSVSPPYHTQGQCAIVTYLTSQQEWVARLTYDT